MKIITHINSTEVDTIEEVSALLQELEGEAMSIRAIRDDKQVQPPPRWRAGWSRCPAA